MTNSREQTNAAADELAISVVTPVFNGGKYIQRCLQNIADQQCPSLEHIIMDGGSTDDTIKIVRRFAAEHPHVRWVSEPDKGQSDALNKGRALARGRILTALCVDDYYQPDALPKAVELFSKLPPESLLVGDCRVTDAQGKLLYVNRPRRLSLMAFLMGFDHPVNPLAYFYDKAVHDRVGGYDLNEHFAMDIHFLYKAVQTSHVVYVKQTFGTFVELPEAKTTVDKQGAGAATRMAAIKRHYRAQLPFHKRAIVLVATPFVVLYRKVSKSLLSPRQTLQRYLGKLGLAN